MPHSKSRNENWKRKAPKRRAKAVSKENKEFEDDTAHAMSKPSELTPLQLERLERSQRILAERKKRKEERRA